MHLCGQRAGLPLSRREMLQRSGTGFGVLALHSMLAREAAGKTQPPPLSGKAKRVIFLFMHGGPSTVDLFDPKPLLTRDTGKAFPLKDQTKQRKELDLLASFNKDHLAQRGVDSELESRIASYELAFKMQMEVPGVQDISSEPDHIKKLYGADAGPTKSFAEQCLAARRFSEAGVRFVQVTHRYWDSHGNLKKEHEKLSAEMDKPVAGLITDLKQRGLLDETLVLWGGEFGRTPTAQGKDGRDHNPHGFTMFMAGGGIKPGTVYGSTDDYGYYAEDKPVHFHDLHATILHLMGIDHEEFTYRYAGRDFRLTDVFGKVVDGIIG